MQPLAAEQSAKRLLAELVANESDVDIDLAGDRTMLPPHLADVSEPRLASVFGEQFVDAISELPLGQWSGPLPSSYGLHLVKLERRVAERAPSIEEVSQAVTHEWSAARKAMAIEDLYEQLAINYSITIERAPEESPQ